MERIIVELIDDYLTTKRNEYYEFSHKHKPNLEIIYNDIH